MGDQKEYISRPDEMGNIHISEEVLAVIAAAAAREVEGVGGLTAHIGTDLAEQFMGKKNLARGIRIHVENDVITIEVSMMVKYGYTIPTVAKAVQDAVMSAVEATSGLSVAAVNVNVSGIVFARENQNT